MKPKGELIKLVKNENNIELDPFQKKFGRGAYICKSAACLKKAHKRMRIERALECSVTNEVYTALEEALNS